MQHSKVSHDAHGGLASLQQADQGVIRALLRIEVEAVGSPVARFH